MVCSTFFYGACACVRSFTLGLASNSPPSPAAVADTEAPRLVDARGAARLPAHAPAQGRDPLLRDRRQAPVPDRRSQGRQAAGPSVLTATNKNKQTNKRMYCCGSFIKKRGTCTHMSEEHLTGQLQEIAARTGGNPCFFFFFLLFLL